MQAGLNSIRIIGRPNLMIWLKGLVHADIKEAEDSLFVQPNTARADIYVLLHKHMVEDPVGVSNIVDRLEWPGLDHPSELHSPLFFQRGFELLEHAEWTVTNPAKADRLVSEWAGFWCGEMRWAYRRFVLVGPSSLEPEWSSKFQHCSVRTPQQLLNDLEKESQSGGRGAQSKEASTRGPQEASAKAMPSKA